MSVAVAPSALFLILIVNGVCVPGWIVFAANDGSNVYPTGLGALPRVVGADEPVPLLIKAQYPKAATAQTSKVLAVAVAALRAFVRVHLAHSRLMPVPRTSAQKVAAIDPAGT
jgi:hypothetical protein